MGDFNARLLYRALDARRSTLGLSWPEAAEAIWELSALLNARRTERGLANHPIAVSTIRNLDRRGSTSCQHALFFLRWLERTPESFLDGSIQHPGAPLPAGDLRRRPRWDLRALHSALAEEKARRGLSWPGVAKELHVTPSQVTGLARARFGTGMVLAMRATQWLERPAADFVYLATW